MTSPFFDAAERAASRIVRVLRRHAWEEQRPPCYSLALVFDWDRTDWYRWAPEPVFQDIRKLDARRSGDDLARAYWDPYLPPPDTWAEPREIIHGLGSPTVVVGSDLVASRWFERDAVQMHESVAETDPQQTVDGNWLTAEEAYAVLVARAIAASDPTSWDIDLTPDFAVFPYTNWERAPVLIRASLSAEQIRDFSGRGLLPI